MLQEILGESKSTINSSRSTLGKDDIDFSVGIYLGVEPKIGGNPPKWMVKIMENP